MALCSRRSFRHFLLFQAGLSVLLLCLDTLLALCELVHGNNSSLSSLDEEGKNQKLFPRLRRSSTEKKKQNKTTDDSFEICLVTSIYASNSYSDNTTTTIARTANISKLKAENPTFEYLVFTNLDDDDLMTPGWTKIVQKEERTDDNSTASNTAAAGANFVPWKHPTAEKCQVIFYFPHHDDENDEFLIPRATATHLFRKQAKLIRAHKSGLALQQVHPNLTAYLEEMLREQQHVVGGMTTLVDFVQAQTDFSRDCPMYGNQFIGVDPRNPNYQELSTFFWEMYLYFQQQQGLSPASSSSSSWQQLDQQRQLLLWAYALDKYRAQPLDLLEPSVLFHPVTHDTTTQQQ